jgi:4-hydroxybenzoyl-CoA thioesterase
MLVNTRHVRIEWGDCDPAGIVYYPRYLAFFDACTAGLFERALAMTKQDYLKAYQFDGHPLLNTHLRFVIPTTFGDDVTIESTIAEFRHSSFNLRHRLLKHGKLAVECSETRVWVKHDPESGRLKGAPVPRDVIDRMSRG